MMATMKAKIRKIATFRGRDPAARWDARLIRPRGAPPPSP